MADNKNAFQWDAYRPLVDRIPACTAERGGSASGPGGVSASGPGVSIGQTPPVDRQTPMKT